MEENKSSINIIYLLIIILTIFNITNSETLIVLIGDISLWLDNGEGAGFPPFVPTLLMSGYEIPIKIFLLICTFLLKNKLKNTFQNNLKIKLFKCICIINILYCIIHFIIFFISIILVILVFSVMINN